MTTYSTDATERRPWLPHVAWRRPSMRGGAIGVRRTIAAALVVLLLTGCSAAELLASGDVDTQAPAERPPTVAPPVRNPAPARVPGEEALVTYIVDGDTFDVVLADGSDARVRPPQIDTPEIGECGYDDAAAALEELILGQTVHLVPTDAGPDRDSYGRLLRAVEIGGHDVGELLVLAGAARWVPRYAHEDARLATMYEAAERVARNAASGSWPSCSWG